MSITAATKVYAVVGDPVWHSVSAVRQDGWIADHGLDAVYVALPLRSADPVVAIGALIRGARGGLGASVDDRTRLLLLSGAVPILVFTLVSFRSIAKINWLAPAYWSLMILGVQYVLTREGGLRRLLRGLASSAILLLAAGLVFWIPNLPVPGDMNSWSGWQEAATRVAKAEASLRAEGRETFVFGSWPADPFGDAFPRWMCCSNRLRAMSVLVR